MRSIISNLWSGEINSWRNFSRKVRSGNTNLLRELGKFSCPVLVAGCQRSGTTAVTRAIAQSDRFQRFKITHDDELDAALILSGAIKYSEKGRHCFQTTYLNERYVEYLEAKSDFQLIWVIRNPYSVVYSMVYNWEKFALNELYQSCGLPMRQNGESESAEKRYSSRVTAIEKACYSYAGKTSQLLELLHGISPGQLMIVDYERVCQMPSAILEQIFQFVGVEFRLEYADMISKASISKKDHLSETERNRVRTICADLHAEARSNVNC